MSYLHIDASRLVDICPLRMLTRKGKVHGACMSLVQATVTVLSGGVDRVLRHLPFLSEYLVSFIKLVLLQSTHYISILQSPHVFAIQITYSGSIHHDIR